jgi:hypothetical protein
MGKKAKAKAVEAVRSTEAKFPYTTKPASLRRLLKEIPKRPKPSKIDRAMLRSWGFSDSNDQTMIRVLKAVNLLNDRNEPSESYSQYMSLDGGAKVLEPEIRRVYAPLFQASHAPYEESNEKLKNLFNIHSGGGDRSLEYQIQTFKALCENTQFGSSVVATATGARNPTASLDQANNLALTGGSGASNIHINLHIHLPENKTRREYEDIIEDIGRYIFGRESSAHRE